MRIYQMLANHSDKPQEVSWHSSEGAAKSARAKTVASGTSRKDHELTPFDLDPSKAGFIAFLNKHKLM